MNIVVIGAGYVGLPTSVCLAELGHQVVCIDKDMVKVEALNRGVLHLYEEGLEELFTKNLKKAIKFVTTMEEAVPSADLVIIAVGTPMHSVTKEADMKYIYAAATELAPFLHRYTLIATKSTVPVGTGDDIEVLIKNSNSKADVDVISLPEFLREGYAVHDFFHPDRIVVGLNLERPVEIIKAIYKPFGKRLKILFLKRRSAEVIKYAANAFLAMKINYVNELADFCEKTEANIFEVAQGIGSDSRIGSKFLEPGPGYGGSCFPKDTLAMVSMARVNNVDLSLVETTIKSNNLRKLAMVGRIMVAVKHISHPKIGVLGLAFKKNTDDCRDSPAVDIVKALMEYELSLAVYDPQAMGNAKKLLSGDGIDFSKDPYEVAANADLLVILTEWDEFKGLNLVHLKTLMKKPNILDFRNIISKEEALKLGFKYQGIGV